MFGVNGKVGIEGWTFVWTGSITGCETGRDGIYGVTGITDGWLVVSGWVGT